MESEMRRHRCCFTGHRPEKLRKEEPYYQGPLNHAIREAMGRGFHTFICGMARGIDIWSAEQILRLRKEYPELRLICALPHPDFEKRWAADWQRRVHAILNAADLVRVISSSFSMSCYQKRNEWMVCHSSLLIAAYNGSAGGTRNTIEFARKQHIEIHFIDNPKEK